jgi:hypothetical protein
MCQLSVVAVENSPKDDLDCWKNIKTVLTARHIFQENTQHKDMFHYNLLRNIRDSRPAALGANL